VGLSLLAQAAAMFAVTNIDDLLVLAVFFGRAGGSRAAAVRVLLGQYLGFAGILIVSVIGALGAGLLPESVIPYLGLLPLLLGLRAAWKVVRERQNADKDQDIAEPAPGPQPDSGPGIFQVATVTFANGGDNIGAYVPVFTVVGAAEMVAYVAVFLIGVAVWCAAGWFLATRPVMAKTLARWGHIILPIVLIGLGLFILIEGGAFGLGAADGE
jgi:cadmium resistance protein CadD (predicted permease)